jgi:EAL domain-containing protein (putative c-di-GMP-specific phosphodiesterase class I)
MDVMCVKFQHHSLEDIEIDIVGSMTDSTRTKSPEKIIEWLYELQSENQKMLHESEEEEVDPDTIERLVIDAVEARSFSYRYQAAYQDDKPVLYEMAVKLVSAEGKLVHQKRFMPVINRLGLLRQFDEIQTEAALKEVPLLEEGQKIAVNVSPSSLRNPLFFEQIMLLMSNNDRLKDRLVFIISENNYFHQVRQFNTRLQAFRRTGIYIALDRLGGQHSSMRYLHDLEVDIVRFESYLGKTITDPKTKALLEGLQHTVKALGYQSWIRMIEDEEQYEAAKKMGIDIKQGRYLSPIDTI